MEALELLVRALVALSEVERARATVTELLALVEDVGSEVLRASALAAGGAEGNPEVARPRFEDTVELFQRGGTPLEAARARIEFGWVLSELGRHVAAAGQAGAAYQAMRAMAAERDAERAAALLRHLGRGRGARTATSLTRPELEVLRLVARGLSNPVIAEQLLLSEHTIHRHLANILSKLGLPSRTATATWGVRSGLI
jgi:ATP/maltotriose-dependent transcriptional regulator MalT